MTTVAPLPHDLAAVDALETIGKPVGYGKAPASALDSSGLPTTDYLVLYPLSSVQFGTLGDPFADGRLSYQVTVVGRLPDGVRWLVGQIEPALASVAITGRSVAQVIPDDLGGVVADRDVGPPHPYYATPRFTLHTVPA